MWPFFSVAKSMVAGLMIGERGEGGVSGQEGRLRSCELHHTRGLPNMNTGSLNGLRARPVHCSCL